MDGDRIERKMPITFEDRDDFQGSILVDLLEDAAATMAGPMRIEERTNALGDVMREWVAERDTAAYRIALRPSQIYIRREHAGHWRSATIAIGRGGGSETDDSPETLRAACATTTAVAEAARRHLNEGFRPDMTGFSETILSIEADAPHHAAAAMIATGRVPTEMRYALATPLSPAIAGATGLRRSLQAFVPEADMRLMPREVSDSWARDHHPFLHARLNQSLSMNGRPPLGIGWTIEGWSFSLPVDMDAIQCLRSLATMPERLKSQLWTLLEDPTA